MRQVMLDTNHLELAIGFRGPARIGDESPHTLHFGATLEMSEHASGGFERGTKDMSRFGTEVRVAVIAEGDVFNVADRGAGHPEHLAHSVARKSGNMFEALAETFFGDGGHEPAVLESARGRIRVKSVKPEN